VTRLPTLEEINEAAHLLADAAVRTPMEGARWLSAMAGGDVRLKCENLQRTGSFKMRGAYLRLLRLSPQERTGGVVAASAGNHAQGVALSAQLLGIKATVFMPVGAPIPKVNATRGYGAEVRFSGQFLTQALQAAEQFAQESGATLIHPFDHGDVVTGQGTCGLEILQQAPNVKSVLVPTGGGGLLAGIAIAIKEQQPEVNVIGVQAEGAAAFPPSLAHGAPVQLEKMRTMADGIAVAKPGAITFAATQKYVDDVLTVSEASLSKALLSLMERAKLVVEPAGAAAVAALLDHPTRFATPCVAVVSGGNIDPLLLGKVIQGGMAAAGRFVVFRVRIPDLPGGLAHLLTEVGACGGNIIDVSHERISPALDLNEVAVVIQAETRGPEHAAELLAHLRANNYRIEH
jgi:threonine dehydratase